MKKEFDIQEYMTKGVERVVADSIKATLRNPKESAFMLEFAAASKAASKKRADLKASGEHIPPFLIASITSKCKLHCEGCYSRCNHGDTEREYLVNEIKRLREEHQEMVFVSFPGDEKSSGGCIAAGRGFFHNKLSWRSRALSIFTVL